MIITDITSVLYLFSTLMDEIKIHTLIGILQTGLKAALLTKEEPF